MKVTSVRSDEVRAILTALIVHDEVLSVVHSRLGEEKRPFEDKYSNTICQWCRAYYTRYQKAPKKHIKQIFHRFADKVQDEDTVALIEVFLSRLSKDYEGVAQEMNQKYILDVASSYFERVRLQRHTESIQSALDNRELEEAKAQVSGYQPLDFSSTAWSNPFDEDSVRKTLRYFEKDRSLIQWPGDLDRFLSRHFERDGFISFVGPEKRGKSFWLLETVYQSLRQRRKVLFYGIGDMSEEQYNRRLYGRILRKPYDQACEVAIPRTLEKQKEGLPRVSFKREWRECPTIPEVLRAADKLRQVTECKELPIKTRCVAADVVRASDVEREALEFARSGWVPDVVVIDYADLLLHEPHAKGMDFRHQENEKWKILRRISLQLHCLVVTATQAAASSYDAKTIRKKDFSEDKRKNAHVTGMIGINQTPDEHQLGLYRLNWTLLRDGRWAETQTIYTAGELAIACPCIVSQL
jgi:hypothetical protein